MEVFVDGTRVEALNEALDSNGKLLWQPPTTEGEYMPDPSPSSSHVSQYLFNCCKLYYGYL